MLIVRRLSDCCHPDSQSAAVSLLRISYWFPPHLLDAVMATLLIASEVVVPLCSADVFVAFADVVNESAYRHPYYWSWTDAVCHQHSQTVVKICRIRCSKYKKLDGKYSEIVQIPAKAFFVDNTWQHLPHLLFCGPLVPNFPTEQFCKQSPVYGVFLTVTSTSLHRS